MVSTVNFLLLCGLIGQTYIIVKPVQAVKEGSDQSIVSKVAVRFVKVVRVFPLCNNTSSKPLLNLNKCVKSEVCRSVSKMAGRTRSKSVSLLGAPTEEGLTANQIANTMARNCDSMLQLPRSSKNDTIRLDKIETEVSQQKRVTNDLVAGLRGNHENFLSHRTHVRERMDESDQTILDVGKTISNVLGDVSDTIKEMKNCVKTLFKRQEELHDFVKASQKNLQESLEAKIDQVSDSFFRKIECLNDEVRAKHNSQCERSDFLCEQIQTMFSYVQSIDEKLCEGSKLCTHSNSPNVFPMPDTETKILPPSHMSMLSEPIAPSTVAYRTQSMDNLLSLDEVNRLTPSVLPKTDPPPYPGGFDTTSNIPVLAALSQHTQQCFVSEGAETQRKVGMPFSQTNHSGEGSQVTSRELLDVLKQVVKAKSSPSVPLKDMPKFDGSDSTQLIKFLEEFQRCKSFCGWDDETSIQKIRDSCLIGYAKTVINDSPEVGLYVSYPEFEKFLKKKFFADSDKQTALSQFMYLKQKPDQSLTEFHQALCELAKIALGHDASREPILVRTFITNLHNPWIIEAVERKCPTNMSQALAMAKDEEGIQLRRKDRMRHFFSENSDQGKAQKGKNYPTPQTPPSTQKKQYPSQGTPQGNPRGDGGNSGGYSNRFQIPLGPQGTFPTNSGPNQNSPNAQASYGTQDVRGTYANRFPIPSGSQGTFMPNSGPIQNSPNAQAPQSGGSTRPGGA